MICAVVLTLNEENILEECLKALDFVDCIFVFDSYSSDRTLEIAEKNGAQVMQRVFDNYASQRNKALNAVPENFDWVLMIDADEIVTTELKDEILKVTAVENNITLYRVRRKDMFQNKWLRYSSGYPTWFPRLFKNGHVEVKREINEEYITTGKEDILKSHLIHYPFNKGLNWWFNKHNIYSDMEAKLMLREMKDPIIFKENFSRNPIIRRKAQKRISYYLPFRPQVVFFAFFIIKGGFLDGKAGYTFCRLRQYYEWMIAIKVKELQSKT